MLATAYRQASAEHATNAIAIVRVTSSRPGQRQYGAPGDPQPRHQQHVPIRDCRQQANKQRRLLIGPRHRARDSQVYAFTATRTTANHTAAQKTDWIARRRASIAHVGSGVTPVIHRSFSSSDGLYRSIPTQRPTVSEVLRPAASIAQDL